MWSCRNQDHQATTIAEIKLCNRHCSFVSSETWLADWLALGSVTPDNYPTSFEDSAFSGRNMSRGWLSSDGSIPGRLDISAFGFGARRYLMRFRSMNHFQPKRPRRGTRQKKATSTHEYPNSHHMCYYVIICRNGAFAPKKMKKVLCLSETMFISQVKVSMRHTCTLLCDWGNCKRARTGALMATREHSRIGNGNYDHRLRSNHWNSMRLVTSFDFFCGCYPVVVVFELQHLWLKTTGSLSLASSCVPASNDLQPPLTDVPNPVRSLQAPLTARDEANILFSFESSDVFEKLCTTLPRNNRVFGARDLDKSQIHARWT